MMNNEELINRLEAIEDEINKISSRLLSFQKHVSDRMLYNRLEALEKIGKLEQVFNPNIIDNNTKEK